MKLIYKWDGQSIFSGTKLVEDDYQPQAGETFVAVPQGELMPIKWTGSAWQQATTEEHAAYVNQQQALYLQQHPEAAKPAGPTVEQQMISTLGQNQAETSAQLKNLTDQLKQSQQMIAMLGAQMAMADAKHNTTTTEGK